MTVRLVNSQGRAGLVVDDRVLDVERLSAGSLPSDPMAVLARWPELVALAGRAGDSVDIESEPFDPAALGPCVPRPQKVFAIALNYRRHAEETGAELPPAPSVFTKFPSCLTGPVADVVLPSTFVDWEAELVVVIGRGGRDIPEHAAFDHVAGYCIGQDFSERRVQMAGSRPQFSLAKSYDTFGPIGPAVVSLDALGDPDDLGIWCEIDGERVQDSRTSDLIFPVRHLVSYLSGVCTLAPGDLIFTGTPSGVGVARQPPRFLRPGEVVTTGIEGLGTMTTTAVAR
ncbi:MAG TPA: fumarylacetoacetate hydrolase family protein [Acidimicrobiales bacterium]|nr:fumarylacetoacetate hydrolase family protein [Acidimicrobiales bacterium]